MERQIFIKFGHDDVVFTCYKCFAIHISFLEEYVITRIGDRCYRFEKVSNDSWFDYQDIGCGCVANCYNYMLEIFYLLLVWNSQSTIELFEIALTIAIVLALILNGHDCLCSMCLASFYFFEKVSKIRYWFERVFSKTRSNSWIIKMSTRNICK